MGPNEATPGGVDESAQCGTISAYRARQPQDRPGGAGRERRGRGGQLVGGLLSGSAAMLAEAAHSIADTVNQGFLLVSNALASRDPTPEQPLGYGRMRFLWTFMAAVVGRGRRQLVGASDSTHACGGA
jgi:Cation efflux family